MDFAGVPRGIVIFLLLLCATMSAIFSGLTLGLMTLDCVQLKMLIEQPDKSGKEMKKAKYAARVLPLRKDGNFLLVTLLVGNVAVNSALTILLDSLFPPLHALLISVLVITLFGEILPQAVCSRHGLVIGGILCPLVWFLEILLYPIVKPIAFILNIILGDEIGNIYSRKQLKALVQHHQQEMNIISRDEARILYGGLDIAYKCVADVMTPMESVFGLDIEGRIDATTTAATLEAGYSRIPVIDKTREQCVVGLVFVRDLIMLDPQAEVPVRSVISTLGRNIYTVDADEKLLAVLSDFKQGHTHIAIVRRIIADTSTDPYYKHIGIITLEDIIEEILQDEIYDEYEVGEMNGNILFQTSQLSSATATDEMSSTTTLRYLTQSKSGVVASPLNSDIEALDEHSSNNLIVQPLLPAPKNARELTVIRRRPSMSNSKNGKNNLYSTGARPLNFRNCKGIGNPRTHKTIASTPKLFQISLDVDVTHDSLGNLDNHTASMLGRFRLEDRRRAARPLDACEKHALALFLLKTQPVFSFFTYNTLVDFLPTQQLQELEQNYEFFIDRTTNSYFVPPCAYVILQGTVKVYSGEENFESILTAWQTLGFKMFEIIFNKDDNEKNETSDSFKSEQDTAYRPSYKAIVQEGRALVLRIDFKDFQKLREKWKKTKIYT